MSTAPDKDFEEFVNAVTDQVVSSVDEIISSTVKQELSRALPKALKEGEFFRRVSDEMRRGLEDIYREIKDVKSMQGVPSGPKETGRLLNEAADQLDEIMRTTEEATVRIMDIVEKHQEMIGKSGDLLKTFRTGGASKEAVDKLCDLQEMHERDLTEIMTTLSFQDLTGQRIKRIVEALKRIEEIVFNVYMSTGLIVKARDLEPEKDMEQLEEEAREKVTKLRGPQENGASQADVDDLLSSLGLE